jgi:hypothetical protein
VGTSDAYFRASFNTFVELGVTGFVGEINSRICAEHNDGDALS